MAVKKKAKKAAKKKVAKKAKKSAALKTLKQKISAAKKESRRLKASLSSKGQKLFKAAVKEIFKEFKNLKSFSWPQYTPHWNDGDECVFSCYFDSLAINDERKKDNVEDVWSLGHDHALLVNKSNEEARILRELKKVKDEWQKERLERDLNFLRTADLAPVAEKYKTKLAITEILEDINESAYEDMFGQGLVTVTRGPANSPIIYVDDYEHD